MIINHNMVSMNSTNNNLIIYFNDNINIGYNETLFRYSFDNDDDDILFKNK